MSRSDYNGERSIKKGLRQTISVLFIASVTFGGLELGLRLFPKLIPLSILMYFPDTERQKIAARLHLPRAQLEQEIIRDDGGPKLKVWRPRVQFHRSADEADLAYGAVTGYKLDADGFCDPTNVKRIDSDIEIVTIGDSFTWCTAVKPRDTWTALLNGKTQFLANNFGRTGIGPYEYIQIYLTFGKPLKPEIVMMNIYEGNDLRDALSYHNTTNPGLFPKALPKRRGLEMNSELPIRVSRRVLREIRDSLLGRSYLIDLLVGLSLQILPKNQLPENFSYSIKLHDDEVLFNEGNADTDEIHNARLVVSQPDILDAFRQALVRFRELAVTDGFRAIVVYTPSAYTAYSSVVSFEDPELDNLLTAFSRRQREWLKRVCGELNVEFVDVSTHLQVTSQDRPLMYFPANLHLTSEGHRAVAEAVADALLQKSK